jgi:flagellar protein FliS
MLKNGYSAYRTANIDTADQGKLILIAYDVAIKHCRQAMEKFADKKLLEQRTKHLLKAQDAIAELMGSLRLDVGEIAHNLYRLYEYMMHSLVEANIKNNGSKIAEVLEYLENLRSAWNEAIYTLKRETAATAASGDGQSIAVSG